MLPGLSSILLIVVSCPHTVNIHFAINSLPMSNTGDAGVVHSQPLGQNNAFPIMGLFAVQKWFQSRKFQVGHPKMQYWISSWPTTFSKTVQFAESDWSIHISVLQFVNNQPEIYGTLIFVVSGLGTRLLCQEYRTPAWPWNEATLLFIMMQFICSGYTVKLEARTVAG